MFGFIQLVCTINMLISKASTFLFTFKNKLAGVGSAVSLNIFCKNFVFSWFLKAFPHGLSPMPLSTNQTDRPKYHEKEIC